MQDFGKQENTLKNPRSDRIALISAPWPMFNRPSLQLGVLKSYLNSIYPDLTVCCHHFFLRLAKTVGYPAYQALSRSTWPAESIYAALLYPEREGVVRRFFAHQAKAATDLAGIDFYALIRRVKAETDAFIDETDWQAFDLAGFSVCLCQLTASLYLIREIRRKVPHLPLIIGGSFIGGRTAADLLKVFPEIDLIVIGEGETPLARLIEQLRTGEGLRDLRSGNGIISRNCVEDADETSLSQLPDLSGLPRPDFSEYFDLLAKFPGDRRFFPTLPLEASRGCWWQSVTPAAEAQTQPKGCAFCNLNVQWQGYRAKAPTQVVSEVENLTSAHKVLSVAFMDNVLPPKQSREIFTALAATGKDFQFFAELRASTSLPMLEILAHAGVSEVQIGIESLSSRLLKKLNKGTTAMDNLEIMKHCEGLGIQNAANLILHFPGSDPEDVAETLRAIRFARFFRPLRIVRFWLGMDSPVWKNPRDFGLKAVFNHPAYNSLFPEAIYRRVQFMVQDYRGDKRVQHKLWRPVVEAVEAWRSDYAKLHADPSDGPILTLHDGRSFLILRERRAGAEPVNHRLEGSSRKIYLFCNRQRRFSDIAETFAPLSGEAIRSFLGMMVRKGLMFAENDAYLSLAVQKRRTRGASPPA